jgi:predicted esterase
VTADERGDRVADRRVAAREEHLVVGRTARYATLGEPSPALREVWFVCHGYGQLATRFIRHFAPLADATRLIVAPEALSRFYLTSAPDAHAEAAVGATWMTREDRLAEIEDYVAYLDALHRRIFSTVERDLVRVCVLGFSQGTATASRWVARGEVRADHLVLWGGGLPPDLDLDRARPVLARLRLSLVVGDRDELARPAQVAEQEERLGRQGIAHHRYSFAGGHRLDDGVLARLAAENTTRDE